MTSLRAPRGRILLRTFPRKDHIACEQGGWLYVSKAQDCIDEASQTSTFAASPSHRALWSPVRCAPTSSSSARKLFSACLVILHLWHTLGPQTCSAISLAKASGTCGEDEAGLSSEQRLRREEPAHLHVGIGKSHLVIGCSENDKLVGYQAVRKVV